MFMIIILNYSLKSEQSINKSIIFATLRMASLPLKKNMITDIESATFEI